MTHLMDARQAGFWLIIALTISGCENIGTFGGDYRPAASGQEGFITVVVDSAQWEQEVGDALRDSLGKAIMTLPGIEPVFELVPVQLTSQRALDRVQERKNILMVGAIGDTSSVESRYVNSFLGDSLRQVILSGDPILVERANFWRRRQMVFFLAAATPDELVTSIAESADHMLTRFNEVTRQRTHIEMFDIGRQRDLEQILMDRHQFAVNGQHDYVIAIDTSQFVWLRRTLSDTWRSLFVHYIDNADPSMLTPEWMLNRRDELTRQYIQGTAGGWVEVDRRRPLEAAEINFKDRFAIELRGLWHMVGQENERRVLFGMGGPFLTYAFYEEETRRLYLIDGMVFAPAYPKREFLRQLEVIAYTFRTRQEAERTSA
ncbi:MAG: DUF4837 family protein [Bacteroidota bacterium]|nr:DUF4837 family protein [Bacteroidota bacterium]MDE2833356.1 DUF4837 family protein [Bacteroidota bacterium]MDE2956380.1 DUF4837 family protein [Bacteroidota bacterium]